VQHRPALPRPALPILSLTTALPLSMCPVARQVLQIHLRAGLEAVWAGSGGSWNRMMDILVEELGQVRLYLGPYLAPI